MNLDCFKTDTQWFPLKIYPVKFCNLETLKLKIGNNEGERKFKPYESNLVTWLKLSSELAEQNLKGRRKHKVVKLQVPSSHHMRVAIRTNIYF